VIKFFEMEAEENSWDKIRTYVQLKSGGWLRYFLEEIFNVCLRWVPGPIGLFLRWVLYRLLISGKGWVAIERGVEIFGTKWIELGKGVYLGESVMLQGRPGGLKIDEKVRVMPKAVLNVYNYRGLGNSGIKIGKGAVIGISAIITGQGEVEIEDEVIIAPGVKIMPVNHIYSVADVPIKEQGIHAQGIKIKKGAWIGAGAIILDGVEVGENAVVGAGSVIMDSVPARSLAGGNPGKLIKKLD